MLSHTLLNRYRLVDELGRGGMGTVYRAHDALLDRQVAIKVLTETRLGAEGRARLLHEARAVARLNHPNIIAIYDVADTGVIPEPPPAAAAAPRPGPSQLFIIMELAQGQTLDQHGPQPLAQTLDIAVQVCAALDHAHTHGIIHGDLKPENIAIAPDGTAKLMDFGLARYLAQDQAETRLMGTVLYLAPEQARGQAVDARADLYALGVVLYEALTGRLPFSGDDPLAVIAQHLNARPTPPRELRPELPPALEAVILRLLAKEPDDRFATASAVKAALAAIPLEGAALSARRHNLPAEVTSFVGRENEILTVRSLLGGTRLLTLTGSGGTGKTRLALRAALEVLGEFRDGIWLVDMAPLADAALVPQSVAGVVGVREEPGTPLTRRIADVLHHKRLLLVLDNCEHLIGAVAELSEALLRACPDLKLLVTSREPLGIAGETAYRVPSLSLPPDEAHTADTRSEAVRLFVDRATTARSDFALTEANTAAVVQIARQLDGVPLALELAAARVRALSVEQIAARLDDRFQLLTGGSRTALPRQQTLRALIDWSWDLLSADEKQLLRRLSVFAGGWTLEAAEAIAKDEGALRGMTDEIDLAALLHPSSFRLHPFDVLNLLTRLVDKSLVVADDHDGASRYRLLETIRQYAREQLLQAGAAEAKAVRGRHVAFFLALVEQAAPALRGGEQVVWLARLEAEHDNLRAALQWTRQPAGMSVPLGGPEVSLRLAGGLARFWYLHGYWSEGRGWLRPALASPGPEPAPASLRRARAEALAGLAWLMDENGEDIPLYQASLALARELDDRVGMATALRGWGATLVNQGEHAQARSHLQAALELADAAGYLWGVALAKYNLGWLEFYRDDAAGASAVWEESLAAFRQTGDRWGAAVSLGALSYVARLRGDYARAVALTEESLARFREVGDKAGIATSLARLGHVAFRRGDYRQAMAQLEEGMALQRELGEQNGLASASVQLGLIATYQGNYERARAWFEESLELAHETGDTFGVAYNTGYLGLVHYCAGELDQSQALWQAGLEQQRANNERLGQGLALNGLGRVAWRRGEWAAAQAQLEESQRLYAEVGDKRYIAMADSDLGQLAHARGDEIRAQVLCRRALSAFRELGDRQGLVETLEGLAAAYGPVEAAARWFGAAQALRTTLGAQRPVVEQRDYDRGLASARETLGAERFEAAWQAGQALPLQQALDEALNE